MSETAINADVNTSGKLQSPISQYLNNQASDHPVSYPVFAHLFTLFQAIVSVFKFESQDQNPSKSLCS